MEIRDATVEDAAAACLVMRRSIAELCVADHGNDKAMLTRWLGNKTPEVFVSWIAQPGNSVLVAIEDGNMLAVGSVTGQYRTQLRLTGCEVARGQPGLAGCARSPRRGTGQHAMHPHKHRDCPALLSGQRLR
jgi:hypothetical protein